MNGLRFSRHVLGLATLILGVVAMGAGCAGKSTGKPAGNTLPPASPATIVALRNVDLRLVALRLEGQALDATAFPTTLRFGDGLTLGGRGPVNRYFGSYELGADGAVSWPAAGFRTTRMAGPELAMRREAAFLKGLSLTTKALTPPDGIRFESADGATVLEFRR